MSQDPPCLRAFRDEIALRTVQEAQRLFPQAIKFNYNAAVTSVDFERQLVHISMDGSNTTEVCTETTSTQGGRVYTAVFVTVIELHDYKLHSDTSCFLLLLGMLQLHRVYV